MTVGVFCHTTDEDRISVSRLTGVMGETHHVMIGSDVSVFLSRAKLGELGMAISQYLANIASAGQDREARR
jgi:hypothetical protein